MKKIIIEKCEDCPCYYRDKFNYLEMEHFCDFSKKEILDPEKIPDWCKLESV